jgi:hypothetical protein
MKDFAGRKLIVVGAWRLPTTTPSTGATSLIFFLVHYISLYKIYICNMRYTNA